MSRCRTLSPRARRRSRGWGSLRPAPRARAARRDAEAVALVQLAQAVEEGDGLDVGDDVRVNLLLGSELGEPRDRVADVALLEERDQLVAEACPGEVADVARGDAVARELATVCSSMRNP